MTAYRHALLTWPVQTKGQAGLRAPQDADTLPAWPAGTPHTRPAPAADNRPWLDARAPNEWALGGGWRMIEAPKTDAAGPTLSLPGRAGEGWLDAVVPGTVLTTYVERGVYPDPDYGLNNFYWHAPRAAGYRELDDLPSAEILCTAASRREGGATRVEVELVNRGPSVALAVQAILRDAASGARLLPAYADDNFVSLLPGERRRILIETPVASDGRAAEVELKGWNLRPTVAPVSAVR